MADRTAGPVTRLEFRAMGSRVLVALHEPKHRLEPAVAQAEALFAHIEAVCTRFDAGSALMRANGAPDLWHRVPRTLIDVVRHAHAAYLETGGVFDPRVYDALVAHGYTHSRAAGSAATAPGRCRTEPASEGVPEAIAQPWEPRWSGDRLHLGGSRIDLGGIGKGYAVDALVALLAPAASGVLVDAGGDVATAGWGPRDGYWHIGVEDPRGSDRPFAVLRLGAEAPAAATSSRRVHAWHGPLGEAHHLIDPATGTPGGRGLLSATVVARDAMTAEVRAKALFLAGANGIAAAARGEAAAWVDAHGGYCTTPALRGREVWRSSHAA